MLVTKPETEPAAEAESLPRLFNYPPVSPHVANLCFCVCVCLCGLLCLQPPLSMHNNTYTPAGHAAAADAVRRAAAADGWSSYGLGPTLLAETPVALLRQLMKSNSSLGQ